MVLHPDGSSDAVLKRGEDRLSRGPLVNRPERVEVPVVVVPEGSRRMTATRGTSPGHAWRFIQRGMVNAGARLEEIANGRGLFRWGQARRVVVYAEAVHARAEIDLVLVDRDPDQRAEQALAHGMQVGLDRGITPFR